jgi:hypothetical protein
MTLSMPSDLSCSTVPDRSLRCISGTARCTQVGRQGGERAGWLSGKQAPQAGGEWQLLDHKYAGKGADALLCNYTSCQ